MHMNELTEFEKLRLFFDKIGLNYSFIECDYTNQMRVYVEGIYAWDVIDLKRENYIELMCRDSFEINVEIYSFKSAKEFVRFILQRFCIQRW